MDVPRMRIAMIGARGVPARAGGVERHVEEVGCRLAERGHEVTVFCRPAYGERPLRTYRGMRLATLPTVRASGAEALLHSALSAAGAAATDEHDVVHFHALGPGLFSPFTRLLTRAAVVQTVHGLDDERDKWGAGARRVLHAGKVLSAHVPDEVVVVSRALQRHYAEEHARVTSYIANGVPEAGRVDLGWLRAHGLEPGRYLVFVGRLVPEKDPAGLVRAYRDVRGDLPLVVVGDSSHTDAYVEELQGLAAADPRVRLVGYRFGDELVALTAGARLFVQPSTLEGLPISLLEATAHGRPVLASDIAPHLEVLGRTGPGRAVFTAGSVPALTRALEEQLATPMTTLRAGADQLSAEVRRRYDWEVAVDRLEQVYARAAAHRHPVRPAVPAPRRESPALAGRPAAPVR